MERRDLNVEVRIGIGKGEARRLKTQNKIPAIFYGPHMKQPVALSVGSAELSKALQGKASTLFTLKASGSEIDGKMALLKDHQVHPVTQRMIHVDLYEVRMDEKIKVSVRLALVGKAAGVAEGGILQQSQRELEVRCLPNEIPDKIEVDVSALNIGDSLHVSDITLPQGITVVGSVNYTIAAVVPPQEEEVAAAATAAVEPGIVGATPAEGAPAAEGAAAAPAAGAKGGDAAKAKSAEPAKAEKKPKEK